MTAHTKATLQPIVASALRAHWRMTGASGAWCGGCRRGVVGRWEDHLAEAVVDALTTPRQSTSTGGNQ